MLYNIEDFENDSSWKSSIGEKLDKVHFRKGHYHAECDPVTGYCSTHFDKDDSHESFESLIKHLADSNGGKISLGVIGLAFLDQIIAGSKLRKLLTGGI